MNKKLLRHTFFIIISTLICTPAFSKITFTEKLRNKQTIILKQDKTLDLLVNGREPDIDTVATHLTPQRDDVKTSHEDKSEHRHGTTTHNSNQGNNHSPNKIHSSNSTSANQSFYYGQGYRVKIFMGGSTRQDKEAAQRFGKDFKNHFPQTSVYMHFVSPHWVCTAGDFQTPAEAYAFIKTVKESGIYNTAEMMVVKSRVKIYQN